jgi:hypothetical protein
MKKYIALLMLCGGKAFAQIPEDALRYSWYPQTGSARTMAIGGAMGSLGGDITSTFTNPAGLGFYRTGEVVFTPGFYLNSNKANFRGTSLTDTKNNFSIGPMGVIFGSTVNNYSKKSGALSIAFTQAANFNNVVHYKGLNNLSSFSESFAEELAYSGVTVDELLNVNSPLPYGAAPAYYAYLIDTVTVNGQTIVRGAPEDILDAGQALQQEYFKKTSGGIYELALGGAINTGGKWLFGGTLGIPIINYNSVTTFKEADTSSSTTNGFDAFEYTDDFTTKGVGVNLKLGAIYRPQEYIRIGLAVHTPSFMFLSDTRTTQLKMTEQGRPDTTISSTTFTNGSPGKSRYTQTAPWKAILSAAYVFRETENVERQKGFVSADIEYVNHRGSRFGSNNEEPTDDEKQYYKDLGKVVKSLYKGALNFRVGGELKFNTIMGRLGFAYYGNPYKDSQLKANRMLLSGGLGYRNKGFFIDLTYVHNITKDVNFPYRLADQANTYASLNQEQGNIVATVGWKF